MKKQREFIQSPSGKWVSDCILFKEADNKQSGNIKDKLGEIKYWS